jgi:hypothetical protein
VPRKVFVAGEILTAANLNDVSDQTVMSFAGTAARGSAIPTPVEGMVTYLADSDQLQVYTTAWGAVSGILQVVQDIKTDTFTTSSASFVDITGLSVAITPKSASSKILIFTDLNVSMSSGSGSSAHVQLAGGNSGTYIGDAASNRVRASSSTGARVSTSFQELNYTINSTFLDSPNTTSAVTYKLQMRSGASDAIYVNRTGADTDNSNFARTASSITVMEVAG